jgi:CyaY protein
LATSHHPQAHKTGEDNPLGEASTLSDAYNANCLFHGAIVMTDQDYMDRAEAALQAIELSCDRINDESDADIDNQRVGGMITLVFRNGSQIVINLQKPLHEIWMAARSGGYHYKFDGQRWMDTKGSGEFFAHLSREASAQSGQTLVFNG